jgi:hypothetical protein
MLLPVRDRPASGHRRRVAAAAAGEGFGEVLYSSDEASPAIQTSMIVDI